VDASCRGTSLCGDHFIWSQKSTSCETGHIMGSNYMDRDNIR
jgi:hypothetical protein